MGIQQGGLADYFAKLVDYGSEIEANNLQPDDERLLPLVEMLKSVEPSEDYNAFQNRILERYESEFLSQQDRLNNNRVNTGKPPSTAFMQQSVNAIFSIARDEFSKLGKGEGLILPDLKFKWGPELLDLRGSTLISNPFLDKKSDRVKANPTLPCFNGKPGEAVVTSSHEAWHIVNIALGQSFRAGLIEPDHPLAQEAEYFMHQADRNARYTVGEAYKNEMDEKTAIVFGNRVAWWLQQNASSTLYYVYKEDGPVLITHEEQPGLFH